MFRKVLTRIHEAEQRWSASYGTDISTPALRRQAWWHFHLADHGFLRVLWTNLYEIAPGVWRSNQPSPARLKRYHQMGIRTILNLRGKDRYSYYLFEHEAADGGRSDRDRQAANGPEPERRPACGAARQVAPGPAGPAHRRR